MWQPEQVHSFWARCWIIQQWHSLFQGRQPSVGHIWDLAGAQCLFCESHENGKLPETRTKHRSHDRLFFPLTMDKQLIIFWWISISAVDATFSLLVDEDESHRLE
jgi:hypothetical protein